MRDQDQRRDTCGGMFSTTVHYRAAELDWPLQRSCPRPSNSKPPSNTFHLGPQVLRHGITICRTWAGCTSGSSPASRLGLYLGENAPLLHQKVGWRCCVCAGMSPLNRRYGQARSTCGTRSPSERDERNVSLGLGGRRLQPGVPQAVSALNAPFVPCLQLHQSSRAVSIKAIYRCSVYARRYRRGISEALRTADASSTAASQNTA
jgi:hypothetical protein